MRYHSIDDSSTLAFVKKNRTTLSTKSKGLIKRVKGRWSTNASESVFLFMCICSCVFLFSHAVRCVSYVNRRYDVHHFVHRFNPFDLILLKISLKSLNVLEASHRFF